MTVHFLQLEPALRKGFPKILVRAFPNLRPLLSRVRQSPVERRCRRAILLAASDRVLIVRT